MKPEKRAASKSMVENIKIQPSVAELVVDHKADNADNSIGVGQDAAVEENGGPLLKNNVEAMGGKNGMEKKMVDNEGKVSILKDFKIDHSSESKSVHEMNGMISSVAQLEDNTITSKKENGSIIGNGSDPAWGCRIEVSDKVRVVKSISREETKIADQRTISNGIKGHKIKPSDGSDDSMQIDSRGTSY